MLDGQLALLTLNAPNPTRARESRAHVGAATSSSDRAAATRRCLPVSASRSPPTRRRDHRLRIRSRRALARDPRLPSRDIQRLYVGVERRKQPDVRYVGMERRAGPRALH